MDFEIKVTKDYKEMLKLLQSGAEVIGDFDEKQNKPRGGEGSGRYPKGSGEKITIPKELSKQDLIKGTNWTEEQLHEGYGKEKAFAYDTASRLTPKWDVSDDVVKKMFEEEHFQYTEGKAPTDIDDMKQALIGSWLTSWLGGSGGIPARLAVKGAAEEAGIKVPSAERLLDPEVKEWMNNNPEVQNAMESLGKIIYQDTQQWLKGNDIQSVHLYRKGWENDDKRPYTSWSTTYSGYYTTNYTEGRTAWEADIPAEQIFSIPATGFGNILEDEVVVMGVVEGKTK